MLMCIIVAHVEFEVPHGIIDNSVFLAGAMVCIGYFYHRYEVYITKYTDSYDVIIFILALMAVLGLSLNLPFMSMHSESARIIPFVLVSLIGFVMTMALSYLFVYSNRQIKSALIYIGNHSLYIYLGHFMAFKVVNILIVWIMGMDSRMIGEFYIDMYIGFWPVYLLCGCALPLIVHYLYTKYITSRFDFDKIVFNLLKINE